MPYDLTPVKAPRTTGLLLQVLVNLAERSGPGSPLVKVLFESAGVPRLRATPVGDEPGEFRVPGEPQVDRGEPDLRLLEPSPAGEGGFRRETLGDFQRAFASGRTTPTEVARRALQVLKDMEGTSPPLRAMVAFDEDRILAQAQAASERYARGAPASFLDGVPVAIKDEMDVEGYPTTVGTSFLGRQPATADAEGVRRLKAAGAVVLGKANMHELGIGVTGLNPHHGPARNPHDPDRCTGGSSSGSACAVSAGLCPIAVGVDGGGSIRIPAALCGVVGLKATQGRIPGDGEAPLDWSLAAMGPLAATVRDAALLYGVLAGTAPQGVVDRDLRGVRVGVFDPWFDDAAPAVVSCGRQALQALQEAGATLVPVEIPELALTRTVHLVTIVSEMATTHLHLGAGRWSDYALETRLNLALARLFKATDYLHAQRHRVRLGRLWARILEKVDVIATPSTAMTAPRYRPDALPAGESDIEVTTSLMRFAQPANLFGLPGISVPAGWDEAGLPVGFQLVGRPWEEDLLLRLALAVEATVAMRPPRRHHRLLT